jgi:hypothetical protein
VVRISQFQNIDLTVALIHFTDKRERGVTFSISPSILQNIIQPQTVLSALVVIGFSWAPGTEGKPLVIASPSPITLCNDVRTTQPKTPCNVKINMSTYSNIKSPPPPSGGSIYYSFGYRRTAEIFKTSPFLFSKF